MIGTFDAAIALPTLHELSAALRFLVWFALVVLLGGILKTIYQHTVGAANDSPAAESNENPRTDEPNEKSDAEYDTNPESVSE